MDCPRCHLINPSNAEQCDCGYDFRSGVVRPPPASPGRPHQELVAAAKRKAAYGAGICLLGIGVTAGTYWLVAEGGGTHIVAWGAMVFGAIQFVRGCIDYEKLSKLP